ncbi:hypothetical protein EX895_003014 [Sporisorium graminicola]|uniref:RRM Nup35-type domain-containing protein n=1 Tax=Sporisorium graminicola TaxID=280036 RepID=A0A4U7KWS8_9BASI|nr:hypothetical protein EX895_003014 [Sporisorium graminicola]TKY87918.1 hypothetical protein EX895_003014 [Sporisorium graminicola]
MFSFSNPAATPQQSGAQPQPHQQQPQSSTPFGGNTGGFNNNPSFSTPGGFSFGNNAQQQTQQQQPQQLQQQQGTPQSTGLFAHKPLFGTPGSQQQQQNTGSLFSNNATSTPNAAHTGQQQHANPFGTPQNNNLFGAAQQQQQQPQQSTNSFGQGAFGSSSPAPFSNQQQQQHQQQQQQQHQQQPQQNQSFGSPFHQQNTQQHHNTMQHAGTPQSSQHQQQQHQHQQQAIDQQRFILEQQSQNMSYIPGYLSRTKVVKPYKLPARQAEPLSPEATQDADTSIAFGTPASKSGKEESTPSSKGQPSPVGRFSSSFFNERRDDASFSRAGSVGPGTPWRGGKESIFGAGGLRGGRQSATPAPTSSTATGASTSPARRTSMDSPARSSRSISTPPAASAPFGVTQGAMDQDDDDDAPPQERLEDEASAAVQSSFLGTSSGTSYTNNLRSSANGADSASAQSLLPGRSALSTASSHALQRTSPGLGAASVNDASSSSARGDASAEKNTALGSAQRTVLVYGYPTWMEKAVLELFAGVGGVELIEAIDLTGSGSAQEQATAQPSSPPLSCCTRIRYAESFQALHALRRNGEVVAGACMVGVRWEDDNFHQVALTNGVDAVFRMDVFPSSRTAETYKASSKSIAVPSIDAAGGGASALPTARSNAASSSSSFASNGPNNRHSIAFGQGVSAHSGRNDTAASTGSGAASGGNHTSYPAFGRPLSVINDPSIAFKQSASTSNLSGLTGSPFKAASSLFGSGAAATSKPATPAASGNTANAKPANASTSMLGRITDGIFGW